MQLLAIKAYSDPGVLKGNEYSGLCPLYVHIANLKDTAELLGHWQELFRKKNGGERNIEYFNARYTTSAERFYNARADIITFGYWHCTASKLAELNKGNAREEFKKLFKDIKQERWY